MAGKHLGVKRLRRQAGQQILDLIGVDPARHLVPQDGAWAEPALNLLDQPRTQGGVVFGAQALGDRGADRHGQAGFAAVPMGGLTMGWLPLAWLPLVRRAVIRRWVARRFELGAGEQDAAVVQIEGHQVIAAPVDADRPGRTGGQQPLDLGDDPGKVESLRMGDQHLGNGTAHGRDHGGFSGLQADPCKIPTMASDCARIANELRQLRDY